MFVDISEQISKKTINTISGGDIVFMCGFLCKIKYVSTTYIHFFKIPVDTSREISNGVTLSTIGGYNTYLTYTPVNSKKSEKLLINESFGVCKVKATDDAPFKCGSYDMLLYVCDNCLFLYQTGLPELTPVHIYNKEDRYKIISSFINTNTTECLRSIIKSYSVSTNDEAKEYYKKMLIKHREKYDNTTFEEELIKDMNKICKEEEVISETSSDDISINSDESETSDDSTVDIHKTLEPDESELEDESEILEEILLNDHIKKVKKLSKKFKYLKAKYEYKPTEKNKEEAHEALLKLLSNIDEL